jgi:hypothetical protein
MNRIATLGKPDSMTYGMLADPFYPAICPYQKFLDGPFKLSGKPMHAFFL